MDTQQATGLTPLPYQLVGGEPIGLYGTIDGKLGVATVCAEIVQPGDHEDRRVWMRVRADDGVDRPDELDGIDDGLPTTAETMSEAALARLAPHRATLDPASAGLVVTFWRTEQAALAA